jgi:integrase
MTFKIYERKDKVSVKKGCPLIFLIGNRRIPTGLYCAPGSWDQIKQAVRGTGAKRDMDATAINQKLRKASMHLQDLIDRGLSVDLIRSEFKKTLKGPAPPLQGTVMIKNQKEFTPLTRLGKDFYILVERILNSHRSDWSNGYKKRFRSLRSKILDYEPNFQMTMLTEEWWRGFVTYCIEDRGNISNTINIDAKTLSALAKEVNVDIDLKWGYIEPEILALTWDKVLMIVKLDFTDHPTTTMEASRRVWCGAALTGRRWAEVDGIGPENFYQRDGEWRYKNIGKGNVMIDVPLLPEAVDFYKSVGFKLPKVANQVVNRDIKVICRILKFKAPVLIIKPVSANKVIKETKEEWETVHVHTARHSFGQHIAELSSKEPHADKFISYMLGHASYRTSSKYLNRSADSNDMIFRKVVKTTQVDN